MRKLLLVILFLATYHTLSYAPTETRLYIPEATAINYIDTNTQYDDLIKAIVAVESSGNVFAYNALENAVGAFQIRQCRIEHYNKLTGQNYTLDDMYNYDKAKRVFLYFALGKSYEKAAKSWNGSGPKTETYWQKVQKRLNS